MIAGWVIKVRSELLVAEKVTAALQRAGVLAVAG
jgi:hypothetical protein